MSELPLFKNFPALEKELPHRSLAALPTPIEPLQEISTNLWIKRDDLTNPLYGGNKVRKLEWLLADAIANNADEIVTFGATGTHHGLATAIYCQQANLSCKIHLFSQPDSPEVRENLSLLTRYGATLVFHESLSRAVLAWYLDKRRLRKRSYFLFAGGSSALGALAFVNAALELNEQIQRGQCPEPDILFCPVGSSGTVAGLTLGCSIAGLSTRVIGVRVAPSHLGPFKACTTETIARLIRQTSRLLNRRGAQWPNQQPPEFALSESYFGDGYGSETPAGTNASKKLFDHAGILLDRTYTAKTFAAVLDHCASSPGDTVCYWHTLNSSRLSA